MIKARFAIAVHFHQPVGNFDEVFEKVTKNCYLPFLNILEKYPQVKMTLHYSGSLLEWLQDRYPELIDKIARMVKCGQVEIMTGGFYEPILPAIFPRDVVGQIGMYSEFLKSKFQCAPKGLWLPERVWEPSLPAVLNEAGVKYVIVDDTHLLYSGVEKNDMYGYYVTESQNKTVFVFPSDKNLRYYIPFKTPAQTIDYFKHVAANSSSIPLFIYGDDGEKFGEWPGTYKWVYDEEWLVDFFEALAENKDWLELVKFSDYIEKYPPLGRVYLPTASYEEMSQWALPQKTQQEMDMVLDEIKHTGKEEAYKPFIRGGFWNNFLVKYPEANHIHKKMLYVSDKIRQGELKTTPVAQRKAVQRKVQFAKKHLYKGQANCAYWHGIFGGIYLLHLRQALYRNLIQAEIAIDEILNKDAGCRAQVKVFDFNADGQEEVIVETSLFSLYMEPYFSGMISEIDYKPALCNFINTISRKKEAYHEKIVAAQKASVARNEPHEKVQSIHEGARKSAVALEERLYYDRYKRGCCIDHFLKKEIKLADLRDGTYEELGDFVNKPYSFEVNEKHKKTDVLLERRAGVLGREVAVSKRIMAGSNSRQINIEYTVENLSGKKIEDSCFGVEFNITLPNAGGAECFYVCPQGKPGSKNLESEGMIKGVNEFGIVNRQENCGLYLNFDKQGSVFYFPVYTVSQSEKGFDLNYQCSSVFLKWDLCLEAGKRQNMSIKLKTGGQK